MTNAKRQKKFRDKIREIKNSPYKEPFDEVLYTERSTGDLWRLFKIWKDHDHVEIAKVTIVSNVRVPRAYRKARIVSRNVLTINYIETPSHCPDLEPANAEYLER